MASDGQPLLDPVDNGILQSLKKRKRNSERARVTRACDRCKKYCLLFLRVVSGVHHLLIAYRRKVKCNGAQPCEFCIRAKVNCAFDSAYSRGRAPTIPPASAIQAEISSMPLDAELTQAIQDSVVLQNHDISPHQDASSTSAYPAASSQSSPEPSQTDLQGHYIGPASGVSFLLRVQKRLHQAISFSETSTIFTFGDAPLQLPEFEPTFCMMLPRDDAQRLVNRYFEFAMPTYRFLHRPTVQEWFDEFYDTLGIMHDKQNAPARLALLFIIFAQARVYMPDDDKPGPPDLRSVNHTFHECCMG